MRINCLRPLRLPALALLIVVPSCAGTRPTHSVAEDAPPASTTPTGVYRAGFNGVTYPVLIESTMIQPRFPTEARDAGVQGNVILEVIVRKDGTVDNIKVLRTPANDLGFEEAARLAVKQWRYNPSTKDGKPVDASFTIVIEFVLKK